MNDVPRLFDQDLLALRRARAARIGGADFLHEAMAAEVRERLSEVNKAFSDIAIVGPRAALWATRLDLRATLVAAEPELAIAPSSFDLLIHGLALHWANDPVGQLVQARRALRPDGLFIAALFGGQTLRELRGVLAEAEITELGGLSPRVAPFGEIRDLGALLQRAGFALPVADSLSLTVSYGDPLALMRDLRAMGETNVMHERLRRPMRRRLLARACDLYFRRFGDDQGRIQATFEVVFLTGWAPSDTQQKPLRPGPATSRLAEALGAEERRLP